MGGLTAAISIRLPTYPLVRRLDVIIVG